jgi:dienelactone hydrolase
MKSYGATLATAFLALATGASAQVQKRDIDIKSSDGVNLKATYFSPARPGPAILLLHQCNMDRHAWDSLARDLAGSGVHVLTIDFRGYGESGGEKLTDAAQRRAVVQEKWPGDVDAAYAYLLSQKAVDTSHVAAGGASCGVTQSSDLAARHHDIKTLMVLSGTATDATRTYIAQTPALAIFGAASEGDSGAAKGIKDILDASKNPRSTIKIYAGTEHGVPMFAKNPELEPMIVTWIKGQLLPKGGTR